jgi:hypothetical protein
MDRAEYIFTKIARDSTYVRPRGFETDPKYFLNTGEVTSQNLEKNIPWILKNKPTTSVAPVIPSTPKVPSIKDGIKKALGNDITNYIKTMKDKIF